MLLATTSRVAISLQHPDVLKTYIKGILVAILVHDLICSGAGRRKPGPKLFWRSKVVT